MSRSKKADVGLDVLAAHRLMTVARQFEEQLGKIFAEGKLAGWFHSCIGHEGTGSVVAQCLGADDYLVPYHRSRVSIMGKGMPPVALAMEILGRRTGPSRGRAGEGHIMDHSNKIYGTSGVLGAGIPIAAGLGYAVRARGDDAVVICSFGEGTSGRGAFHEGLNMAAIWDLPVVYICENNLYVEFSPVSDQMKIDNVADRGASYGIPNAIVDGNDPTASYPTIAEAVLRAREGGGPTLIEAKTYRQQGHYEGDPQAYRTQEEKDEWAVRDPLLKSREHLLADGTATEETLDEIDREATAEIAEAMDAALEAPLPTEDDVLSDVYGDESIPVRS